MLFIFWLGPLLDAHAPLAARQGVTTADWASVALAAVFDVVHRVMATTQNRRITHGQLI